MDKYTIDGDQRNFRKSFEEAKSSIEFNFLKEDLTGAEELAAKFPKYCKATISGCSSGSDMYGRPTKRIRTVYFRISLATNKTTGDVNETAVKRRNKILEILKTINI